MIFPLYEAVEKNRLDLIDALVRHGAKLEALNTFNRRTALFRAVELGRVEMTEALIRNKANVETESVYETSNPLMQAVMNDDLEIVELLLDNGAHPRTAPSGAPTQTPMSKATEMNRIYIIETMEEWLEAYPTTPP